MDFLRDVLLLEEGGDVDSPKSVVARGIKDDFSYFGFRMASPKSFRRYFNTVDLPDRLISKQERHDLLVGMATENTRDVAFREAHVKWRLYYILEVIINNEDYKAIQNDPFAFVKAADYLIQNVERLEAFEEGKQYRTIYDVCKLVAENLAKYRVAHDLSASAELECCDWVISSKAYAIALFFLYYGGVQFEPSIQYNPGMIDGEVASKLWEWINAELSCKIFDSQIDDRKDSWIIQKWFMLICLERLPVDGEIFKKNCQYFVDELHLGKLARQLNALFVYKWRGPDGDEQKQGRSWVMEQKEFYMNVLSKAEKTILGNPAAISDDDLRFVKTISLGYNTPMANELGRLFKQRLGE